MGWVRGTIFHVAKNIEVALSSDRCGGYFTGANFRPTTPLGVQLVSLLSYPLGNKGVTISESASEAKMLESRDSRGGAIAGTIPHH